MVGLLKGIVLYGSIILGLNAIGNIGVDEEKYVSENTPVAIEETIEDTEMRQYFYEVCDLAKDKKIENKEEEGYIFEEEFCDAIEQYIIDKKEEAGIIEYTSVYGILKGGPYELGDTEVELLDNYYIEVHEYRGEGSVTIYNYETNELIKYMVREESSYRGSGSYLVAYYYNSNANIIEYLSYNKNYEKDIYEHIYELEYLESKESDPTHLLDSLTMVTPVRTEQYILNKGYIQEEEDDTFKVKDMGRFVIQDFTTEHKNIIDNQKKVVEDYIYSLNLSYIRRALVTTETKGSKQYVSVCLDIDNNVLPEDKQRNYEAHYEVYTYIANLIHEQFPDVIVTCDFDDIVVIHDGQSRKNELNKDTADVKNNSDNENTIESEMNDEIVYWTRGKSYHKDSNCHNYVQAKYHYSGTMKECPKFDPCDDCCK
jgi:hypothetical protein